MVKLFRSVFIILMLSSVLLENKVYSQAPSNDFISNALSISASTNCNPYSYQGSYIRLNLNNATGSGTQKDVFYKFVATTTAYEISFSTSCISCIKYSLLGPAISMIGTDLYSVTKGETYYIQFYSISESNFLEGAFCLFPGITNDSKSIPIVLADDICSDNSLAFKNATKSVEPFSCTTETDYVDIWYSFVATSNSYVITANSSTSYSFYTELTDHLNKNIACATGKVSASNSKATASISVSNLIIGATYYIRTSRASNNADNSMKVCAKPNPAAGLFFDNSNLVSTRIYPVPASEVLNIDLKGLNSKNGHLELYDITGKIIRSIELEKNLSSDILTISVSDLEEGFYMIGLKTSDFNALWKFSK